MKNIMKIILPKKIKIFFIEHRYMFKIIRNNYKGKLNALIKQNKSKDLSFDDSKKWVKKIVKLAYSNPKYIELGKEFATAKITIIKDIEIFFNDVIAICIEKNDLIKLKKFISHHRKIGVNKVIILDNESNDGTVEWLLKQEDVILLQTKTPYSSIRRVA